MQKTMGLLIRCSCLVSLVLTMSQGVCRADDEAAPPLVRFGPSMFGDFPVHSTIDFTDPRTAIEGTGSLKIGEMESPRPQNRLFVNYNFNRNKLRNDYHYDTLGFEKTFLHDDISAGVRVPVTEAVLKAGRTDTFLGDVTVTLKYAPLRSLSSGNLLSFGLAVTLPTSPVPDRRLPTQETVDSTLLQPFVGYVWDLNAFFIHGFSSVLIPTDSRDLKLVFNDIGVGYWLYRGEQNGRLAGVVPTLEVHVNTPYGTDETGIFPPANKVVDLTGGVTFFLRKRMSLGAAVSVPATERRQFDTEVIANFTYRF